MQEDGTRGEKDQVPEEVIAIVLDLVDLQDLMVEKALDTVEEPPRDQHRGKPLPDDTL